ncbi:MAG: hypothetical protein IT299_09510 [Dehalococcoidia bacterium]|nr:hypothetical protein [Dehalococcoidia bacterium]
MTHVLPSGDGPPHEAGRAQPSFAANFYRVADGEEVRALRVASGAAMSRWLATHVELGAAARRTTADARVALEAHAGHLAAMQAWQGAEGSYVAAHLGFRAAPLPSRRRA